MKTIALVLLVALCSNANAGWINKQGANLPDSEDRKAIGDFGAQLVFVTDEHALFKTWATPSETVDLKTVESVTINQPISNKWGQTRHNFGISRVALQSS